jgi:hypothetical protein
MVPNASAVQRVPGRPPPTGDHVRLIASKRAMRAAGVVVAPTVTDVNAPPA